MWTAKGNGVPDPWVTCVAVYINRKIYAFRCDEQPGNIAVYVFHPNCYRWNLAQANALCDGRPLRVFGFTVVAYGDFAYLWGGRSYGAPDNALYRLHANTMTWSRPEVTGNVPVSTFSHSSCVIGQRMYIFGGSWSEFSQDVHFLDLERMQWHRISTNGEIVSNLRGFHTACAIGTRMYIWGGGLFPLDGINDDNSIVYLETTTSTWVRPHVEGALPNGRVHHSAFVHKGEMYIFGGSNHGVDFSDMHKFNPENSRWTQVTPRGTGPSARRLPCCCVAGDKVFIFNGMRMTPPDRQQVLLTEVPDERNCDPEVFMDLHVLDFAPTLRTLCIMAIINGRLDVGHLPPIIRREICAMTVEERTYRPW